MRMKTIRLTVTGQSVRFVELPRLVAGSINVYELQVSFDASWEGMAKTAVFAAGVHSPVEQLLVDGACMVPPEVLLAANPPEETDPTVPAWAKAATKPAYTAMEVGADPSGTAEGKVNTHNTAEDAHGDIRLLVTGLTNRLNALANSDDTTLDQLSEIVAYIKSNRTLIDSITTGKVSTSDIIDNLTTSASDKPLSAKQGVALKMLIDAIVVPDTLPNPKALTLTGAVSATYDGSEAVKVEIPEGGGSSGGENWELLADITVPETVNIVEQTLDNPGKFRRLFVICTIQATEVEDEQKAVYFGVNDQTLNQNPKTSVAYVCDAAAKVAYAAVNVELFPDGYVSVGMRDTYNYNGWQAHVNKYQESTVSQETEITKVKLRSQLGWYQSIIAGSTFRVWGVRV